MRESAIALTFENHFEPADRYYYYVFAPLSESTFLSSALDITDIRRSQQQTEEYSKKLRRSNDDLQQLAYVASHDLKEPLRMVTSYLQLLRERNMGSLDERSSEYMRFALEGATRMRQMIDNLLIYARVETQDRPFVQVDMEEVLAVTLKDLSLSIKESGATLCHDGLPMVRGDVSQLVVLLENLVSNAIKYRGERAPQINISAQANDDEWVFSIQDNGIGIKPEHKNRLFQMFQRLHTREEYEGTGMGLALSRRIVEHHGGRIWFESVYGKGTTFYFTIPKQERGRPARQIE